MNGLAAFAVHNAVAALLLAVVVGIVTRIVRRPAVAHVLWLLVLLRMIAPPLFDWNCSELIGSNSAATSIIARSTVVDSAGSGEFTTAGRLWSHWMKRHGRPENASSPAASMRSDDSAASSDSLLPSIAALIRWLPTFSLAVTVVAAIIAGSRVLRFRRLLSRFDLAADSVQRMVQESAKKLGIVHVPVVRISPATGSPFVLSVGRQPVVVVPASLVAALSTEQLAMVLAHELAHLRRRDHWVRWIELVAVLACWWNPLVYWARRRLHEAEELCCDAWVACLFPDGGRTYADALLRATELSQNTQRPTPLLYSPLFRIHPLKTRIAMIVQGRTSHRNSRAVALLLAAAALVVLPSYVTLTAADDDAAASAVTETFAEQPTESPSGTASTPATAASAPAEQPLTYNPDDPGLLEVSVVSYTPQITADGKVKNVTRPVEGATIGVFLGLFDDSDSALTASSKTGPSGSCSIPVPYGQIQTMPPMLPAGYWMDFDDENQQQYQQVAINAKTPVYAISYGVHPGPVWKLIARNAETSEPVGLLQCDISPRENRTLNRSGPTVLDAAGAGAFTPPGLQGEFQVRLFGPADGLGQHTPPRFVGQFQLSFDEGFDPSHVAEARPAQDGKPATVIDTNGRTAELTDATAVIENGMLSIEAHVEPFTFSPEVGRGVGSVVDPDGRPVAGARVTTMIHTAEGDNAWSGLPVRTDADGRFTFEHLTLANTPGQEQTQVLVVVEGHGFAPTYSGPIAHPHAAGEMVDFGRITLAPGRSARVKVLNGLGDPVVGAVVGSTFSIRPTSRNVTAENGEVVINDLPAGNVHLMAAYAGDYGGAEITVPDDGQVVTATLQLQPRIGIQRRWGGTAQHPVQAPPFEIAGWTDGNTRSLEALRGRVVVLYFWDLKQEGCDQELVVIDNLKQRFAEDGVVFLGIHSGGSTLDEVRAWMKERDWRLPTGLDQANDAGQSLTMEAYGVSAPSFVVIAANGNISFNRDEVDDDDDTERLYMQAAHALNIPWPIEESDADAEGCEVCLQLMEYIERRMIETALGR